jgi:hypothetical protein
MKIIQKQSSSNHSSEYIKNMKKLSKLAGLDHQFALEISTLIEENKAIEKKLSNHYFRLKKLEKSVDCIENYIEELTDLKPSKELTDSSESSSSESEIEKIVESECGSFKRTKSTVYYKYSPR